MDSPKNASYAETISCQEVVIMYCRGFFKRIIWKDNAVSANVIVIATDWPKLSHYGTVLPWSSTSSWNLHTTLFAFCRGLIPVSALRVPMNARAHGKLHLSVCMHKYDLIIMNYVGTFASILFRLYSNHAPPPHTKWLPFRRRYFHTHFREWNVLYFD